MYSNKMAFAVKVNGKVLREFKDKVYIPFGSEYSLLIKNLHTVRALVTIEIDGKSVNDGGFIVSPNSEFELERFVKNLNKGNRFKFIERTGKIEEHRGVKMDDGLIRIEYQFEKLAPKVEIDEVHHYVDHIYHDYYWPRYRPYYNPRPRLKYSSGSNSSPLRGASFTSSASAFNCSVGASAPQTTLTTSDNFLTTDSLAENDVGITVAGSESHQKFSTGYINTLEETKHSMVIHLLGESSKGHIAVPVTVKHKNKCTICGHQNKVSAKFCSECGTALEVIS